MKLSELLLERILVGEFTFGFELEAIYNTEDYGTDSLDARSRSIVANHIRSYFPNVTTEDVITDGSVKGDGFTFEWPSPAMSLNVANLQTTLKFLNSLRDVGIFTNETCGFHVHFSYPNYKPIDGLWILCHLANDPELRSKITSYDGIDFVNPQFASEEFLNGLHTYVQQQKWGALVNFFSTEKYRVLRLHPQGTIEWRGPRAFLQRENIESIKGFLRRVWDVARTFSILLDRRDLNGISKEEFYAKMKVAAPDNELLKKSLKKDVVAASLENFDAFKHNYKKMSAYQILDILERKPDYLFKQPFMSVGNIRAVLHSKPSLLPTLVRPIVLKMRQHLDQIFDEGLQDYLMKHLSPNQVLANIPNLHQKFQMAAATTYPGMFPLIKNPSMEALTTFLKKHQNDLNVLYTETDLYDWLRSHPDLFNLLSRKNRTKRVIQTVRVSPNFDLNKIKPELRSYFE